MLLREYGSTHGEITECGADFSWQFYNTREMDSVLDFVDHEKMLWINFKRKEGVELISE